MIHIQKKMGIFLLCTVTICSEGSDTIHTSEQTYFSLSQLTHLVGFLAALKIPSIALEENLYTDYKNIKKLPTEVQHLIINSPVLYKIYQNIYLKNFKKAKTIICTKPVERTITLSAIDDTTIAIAQPLVPIEIWSIKNDISKKIFTSLNDASYANTYHHPLLISSTDRTLCTWNTTTNYQHNKIPTDHHEEISFIFSGPGKIISCGFTGVIGIHNTENLRMERFYEAHDGQIFSGKTISEHVFITGAMDGFLRQWDIRQDDSPITEINFKPELIPYGLQNTDDKYIIVGGSRPYILILDTRKNLQKINQMTTETTLDMDQLKDKTLIFGEKKLCFTTWDGTFIVEKNIIPTPHHTQTIITTPNDSIVHADSTSRICYIKPRTRPYHTTQDASLETFIMATLFFNDSKEIY